MKKIRFILLMLLVPFLGLAQTYTGTPTTWSQNKGKIGADKGVVFTFSDTIDHSVPNGTVRLNSSDTSLYVFNGAKWIKTIRIAASGGGSSYTFISPLSVSNDTVSINLSAYATTSALSSGLASKVNNADTATMLSKYLRKIDTTSMLGPYARTAELPNINGKLSISDTASMLSPYQRISTAAIAHWYYADDTLRNDSTNLLLKNKTLTVKTDTINIINQNATNVQSKSFNVTTTGGIVDVNSNMGEAFAAPVITFTGGAGGESVVTVDEDGLKIPPLASEPAGGSNGVMYYDIALDKFRAYENGAWTDMIRNTIDTASMLVPYLRKVDTTSMLTKYLRKVDTTSMLGAYYDTRDTGRVVTQLATGGSLNKVRDSLQTNINLKANLASPTFTGVPAGPTASALTNTTQLATTAFVTTADNLKANIASPTFTGTPAAPTAAAATNTTQLATTAFVFAERANTATLTNKTLTSPSIATPLITGVSSGTTNDSILVADATTGAVKRISSARIGGGGSGYGLTGNTGLSSTLNWLGNNDDISFNLKVNNVFSGEIAPSAYGRTHFGYNAGTGAKTALSFYETLIGSNAGPSITGNGNTGVGEASFDNGGALTNSVAIGRKAATTLNSGDNNVAIGYFTGLPSTSGSHQLNIQNVIWGVSCNGIYTSPTTPAGRIGIGTNAPNASAILDLTSTTQGFLPPRATTAQQNAISTPVNGLTIYNTDLKRLAVYDGSAWTSAPSVSTGTAAPATTPLKVGDMYIDTTNKKTYSATGTSSSSDWTILN